MRTQKSAIEKMGAEKSAEQKLHAAQYGSIDMEALWAAHFIHNAARLVASPGNIPDDLRHWAEFHHDAAWKMICKIFLEAFAKRDGSFLKKMADAIAMKPEGIDPVWAYVGGQIDMARKLNLKMPTQSALLKELKKKKIPVSPSTIKRAYHFFEETGKPGRPRKQVNKT